MVKDTLLARYCLSQRIITINIEGVTHAESLKQPSPAGNCLNWIAGHILATRGMILGLLGGKPFLSEQDAGDYIRGSAPVKPGGPCVEFGLLKEGLEQTSGMILEKIQEAGSDFIEEPLNVPDFPVKLEKPSRDAYLTLLLVHEEYHCGQLGLGRRLLGKDSAIK